MADSVFPALDFQRLFEVSPELMCIASLDGYFKRVNPAFERVLGFRRDQLTRTPYMELVHPLDRESVQNALADVASGAVIDAFECRFQTASGDYRWLSWTCAPLDGVLYATARDVTKAKKKLEETMESEVYLGHILQRAPISLFVTDKEGVLRLSVGHALRKGGLKDNQNVGKNMFQLYGALPDVVEPLTQALAGIENSRRSKVHESVFKSVYSPLRDEEGNISGVVGVAIDVTEADAARQRIDEMRTQLIQQEAEEKYRETFDHVAVGLSHVSLDGRIIRVNRQFCEFVGYDESELLKMGIHDITHPEDCYQDLEKVQQLLAGSTQGFSHEKRYLRKDGSVLWVFLRVSVVRDAHGQPKYFIGAQQDITLRKKFEISLRESEEKFRYLSEAIPMMIWTADGTGAIDYINHRWHAYTGLSLETILGWGWLQTLHPEDLSSCVERWGAAFRSGEYYEMEARMRNGQNGTYRWHLTRAVPVKNEAGQVLKWFGTCTDIDDQRRAREELQANLTELQRISHERSRLAESERAALEASKLKSEFLANMSHEIRTPLNGLLGMTDLLLETKLKENQADLARTIRQAGRTLLDLLNDILDLSKIEAGKLHIESNPFDGGLLFAELERLMLPSVEAKGLKFSMSIKTLQGWFHGDFFRLRQILLNLVQNAVKFTVSGSVGIKARFRETGGRSFARFEVHDTGIGLSPEVHQAIFEPFRQGDASTTRRYGGTGLGLSICKKLIEQMNGRIGVVSSLGKGSTFWFEIPLERATAPKKKQKKKTDDVPRPRPRLTKEFKILVAEDNSVNRRFLAYTLERAGAKVEFVENGRLAVEAAERNSYDLILMDCHMPEMDGFEATRRIRRLSGANADIPIVALTADVLKGTRERCTESGMNDYLRKPIEPARLVQYLAKHISDSRGRVLDLKALKRLQSLNEEGKPDIIQELIEDFLGSAPGRISKIRAATLAGQAKEIGEAAHALKSAAAMLGAIRLAKICARFEVAAEGGNNLACGRLLAELDRVYSGTAGALQKRLQARVSVA